MRLWVGCVWLIGCHGGGNDIVKELTATKQPALVGPFRTVALSTSLKSGDLGDLCKNKATIAAWCEYRSADYSGVIFRAQRDPFSVGKRESEWQVDAMRITLPAAGLRDKLVAAWGQPRAVAGTDYWFDPAKHLRVALHKPQMPGDPPGDVDLDFEGYTPVDEFVATGVTAWYGLSKQALERKAGPRLSDDHDTVRLWPVDTADRVEAQDFEYGPDRTVAQYTITIMPPLAGLADALAKRSASQPAVSAEGGEIVVGEHGRTKADDDDE